MILTVFRSRCRDGIDIEELGRLGSRMYELASEMSGFGFYKDFAAEDGEQLTLVAFETAEQLLAWRDHAEHVVAQERGRQEFFTEYSIAVCQVQRAYHFNLAQGRVEIA